MCTKEGVIFDILNIMPYVRKHKKNPVTGEALAPKDLVRLNISKNGDGKWHCPVTFKVNNTYILSPVVLLLVVVWAGASARQTPPAAVAVEFQVDILRTLPSRPNVLRTSSSLLF